MARPRAFDRDEALDLAMRLFWAKGYAGTAVSELTAGMGLSRSSLYETFGSKEALFLEALARYVATLDRWRARTLGGEGPARAALREYFTGILDFTLRGAPPGGCFLSNAAAALSAAPARARDALREADERQERDLLACLRRAEARGELRPGKDLRALARFLGGLARGVAVLAPMRGDRAVLEDVVAVGLAALDGPATAATAPPPATR